MAKYRSSVRYRVVLVLHVILLSGVHMFSDKDNAERLSGHTSHRGGNINRALSTSSPTLSCGENQGVTTDTNPDSPTLCCGENQGVRTDTNPDSPTLSCGENQGVTSDKNPDSPTLCCGENQAVTSDKNPDSPTLCCRENQGVTTDTNPDLPTLCCGENQGVTTDTNPDSPTLCCGENQGVSTDTNPDSPTLCCGENQGVTSDTNPDSPTLCCRENQGVTTDTNPDSNVRLLNSPVTHETRAVSLEVKTASEAFRTKLPKPSFEATYIARVLSADISLSQSSNELTVENRFTADVQIRFNSVMLYYGRNHRKTPHLELSASRFQHLEFCQFALLIKLQSSAHQNIPVTCRQSTRGKETTPKMQSPCLSRRWTVSSGVLLGVRFTVFFHRSQFRHPAVLESSSMVRTGRRLRNSTISKFKADAVKLVDEPADVLKKLMRDDKDFPHCPFWTKTLFSLPIHQLNLSRDQNYTDNTSFDSFVTDLLYKFIIFLAILYKCRTLQRDESKKDDHNTVPLKLFTKSFFLKWHWNQPQNEKKSFSIGQLLSREIDQRAAEQTRELLNRPESCCSKSPLRQTSMLKTLSEYVFRPWRLKAQSENDRSCLNPSELNSCTSFNTLLCSSCRRYLDHFRAHNQHIMQVSPVTSFLPNPTCDPALDLAHVGYRLATLSALPASVPVSRIKLADSGFYFRGQNDEVRCYSCDARHSEWTREDNPMEIHRRLSPNCEHLLRRDRELSALARSLNLGGVGQENTASGTGINTPAEDGQGSQARAQPPAPASRETVTATPSFRGPVVPPGAGSSSSDAGTGVPAGGNAAREEGGSHERGVPSTSTGPASPSAGTTPGAGNRMGNIPNTVSASTLTTTSDRVSTSVNGVPDGNNRRTSTVVPNANSSPRPSGGGGVHGDNAAARAEPRPLFPRAALDLGGAVYPMYQDMASRRRTFSHWDDSQAPPLDDVILCGMFYAGYADCVRCFYCGVGLKHWVATDDVWTEHVRWRPGCEYLKAIKGDDFIRDTQRRLGIQSSREQSDRSRGSISDAPHGSRNDNSAPPAPAQGQEPTTATWTTSSTTTAATTWTTTAATATTSSVPAARTSPASSTSAVTANTGQRPGATASLSGATAAAATTSSPSASPSGRSDDQAEVRGDNAGGASVTVAVSSAAEDRERLARLEAENRALSQRLRCRVCCQAAIDTILMPCGHLVVCETCARSVTSCPLCQDTIRATARVNIV